MSCCWVHAADGFKGGQAENILKRSGGDMESLDVGEMLAAPFRETRALRTKRMS